MAFTRLTADVANISALPDSPSHEGGYTAQSLKAEFDKAAVDIKGYINETLLPGLESTSAAGNIGSAPVEGLSGENNLHAQIAALAGRAVIPDDGSVTEEKLSQGVRGVLNGLTLAKTLYTLPGDYVFTAPRTGTYKITAVGGGACGTSAGGGMSGACGVAWLLLGKDSQYELTVGAGGAAPLSEAGGDSVFAVLTACGGTAHAAGVIPDASGADITVKGSLHTPAALADDPARAWGGDTPFGRGSRGRLDPAGIGGGGCGDGGQELSDGGNGMVLIEYVGI